MGIGPYGAWSKAGGAEAAFSPGGLVQGVAQEQLYLGGSHQQKLSDAVTIPDGKGFFAVVDQVDLDLAPVVSVDEADTVGQADTELGSQTLTAQQKTAVMLGNGHAQAGGNQLPFTGL